MSSLFAPASLTFCSKATVRYNLWGSHRNNKLPKRKIIDVLNANYGRLDSETCSAPSETSTSCRSSNSLKRVQNKCNGKTSCELHASTDSKSDDPCYGTYKYLEVKCRWLKFINLGQRKNDKMCLNYASHCSYRRQYSMTLAHQCC